MFIITDIVEIVSRLTAPCQYLSSITTTTTIVTTATTTQYNAQKKKKLNTTPNITAHKHNNEIFAKQ